MNMSNAQHRILLVEDKERGKFFKEYLELKGLNITWIQDAEEAYDKALKDKFHLFILDIMMPLKKGSHLKDPNLDNKQGMLTGFHLLKKLNSNLTKSSPLKVILFSARPLTDIMNDIPNGIPTEIKYQYIPKSAKPSKLLKTIQQLLNET